MRPTLLGLALCGGLLLTGCGKTDSATTARSQSGVPAGKAPAVMGVQRAVQRANVSNELKNLVLYYQGYYTDFGRSPAKIDDLKASILRDMPTLYQGIEGGYYVVFWGLPTLSSNVVLAHEKEADANGFRMVAMADGSIQKMNEQEFQAALKGK